MNEYGIRALFFHRSDFSLVFRFSAFSLTKLGKKFPFNPADGWK